MTQSPPGLAEPVTEDMCHRFGGGSGRIWASIARGWLWPTVAMASRPKPKSRELDDATVAKIVALLAGPSADARRGAAAGSKAAVNRPSSGGDAERAST